MIQSDFENIGFDEMQKNLWRYMRAMMLDRDQSQQVLAHCDPYFRFDGIGQIANKVFDRQILLESLERSGPVSLAFGILWGGA